MRGALRGRSRAFGSRRIGVARRASARAAGLARALGFAAAAAVLVASGSAFADESAGRYLEPLEYVVDRFTTAQGLPQNSVHALLQTRDGSLWIGTEEGLVRYDGTSFVVHDVASGSGIPIDGIWTLHETADGVLWVGTAGGGLARAGPWGFEAFTRDDGLPHEAVSAIATHPEGGLWIGTWGGVARIGEDDGITVVAGDELDDPRISGMLVDGDALWLATLEGGLWRLDPEGVRRVRPEGLPEGARLFAIERDPGGGYWLGTGLGVYHVEDGVARGIRPDGGLAHDRVYALHADGPRAVWVATLGGGLDRVTRDGGDGDATGEGGDAGSGGVGHGLRAEHIEGIPFPTLYTVLRDRDGSVWVGTNGAGMYRLRWGSFSTLGEPEGLVDDMVTAVLEDRRGDLWVGTATGLQWVGDGATRTYGVADGLPHDQIATVYEDRAGTLWVGTWLGGLSRRRGGGWESFDRDDGLPAMLVRAIEEPGDGTMWVGTNGGLCRFRDGRCRAVETAGLATAHITSLDTGADGVVWVGTDRGVARVTLDASAPSGLASEVRWWTEDDGLPGPSVHDVVEGADGTVWVGMRGGLAIVRDVGVTAIEQRHGLADDAVYRIVFDDDGALWVTGNKGVCRHDPDDLIAFAEGRVDRVTGRLFGRGDGMREAECTGGGGQPAGTRTRDGRLWFTTVAGLAVVDPTSIAPAGPPPEVTFARIVVDGLVVDPASGDASRPRERGELEVHYVSPMLVDPRGVRFRYRLAGLEETWTDAGSRRVAHYSNLAAGEYRFEVAAARNGGAFGESTAFSIRLVPRLWERPGFQGAVGAALLFAVGGAYVLRVRGLRRKERELRREVETRTRDLTEASERLAEVNRRQGELVAGVTHGLKTPLTLIRLFAENLLDDPDAPPAERRDSYRIIAREGERLTHLIERVLDYSKLDQGARHYRFTVGPIDPLVRDTVEVYGRYLTRRGFTIETDLRAGDAPVRYDGDAVATALVNLLDNAAKYSGDSSILAVRTYLESGTAVLEVEDSGVGIADSERDRIFDRFYRARDRGDSGGGYGLGLYLVREIMDDHGGSVDVVSRVGAGSRFRLLFALAETGEAR